MIDALSKASFHALAGSRILKRLASRYGMARPHSFARRFIAGETLEEAIAAARAVEARGLTLTLDYLGESAATLEAAEAATCEYLRIVDAVVASGITRNISLKLTQLGLALDHDRCLRNLRRILERARAHEFFVRIDMENSPYVEATLRIFETLWARRVLERRRRAAVGTAPQRGRPAAYERARRPNTAGQGRLQGAARCRLAAQG